MTSPNVDVTITGSESVSGAAARAQAAIDALHGRSIDVDFNIRNGGAPSGFASAAQRAADSAGGAFRGFSDHVNRAADDMSGFRDMARDAGRDLERIGRGRSFFNDGDVSAARSIRGEIERMSIAGGDSGGFRQLEQSSSSLRAIESATGGAGREMRALESGSSRAAIELREVNGVYQAVEERGSVARRVIDAVGRVVGDSSSAMNKGTSSTAELTGSLSDLTGIAGTAGRVLGGLGIAGLYAAAGSGIGAAAVGGMGFAAVVADIASSAPTLSKAKNLVTDFGEEFRKVAPETTKLAMPGLENMSDQAKAIGAAGAQMGLAHMPEMFRVANTALAQVIPTARALEPAISPAVGAAESLVQQAPRIAAGATPGLIQFSNVVANSSEGLGNLAIVGAKTATALGSAAVSVASTWGDRLNALDQAMPEAIPASADFIGGLFGGKSNLVDPNSQYTSAANKAGQISGLFGAGGGATIGGLIGGAIGLLGGPGGVLAGAAIGSTIGAGAGAGVAYLDDKLPQQDAATVAGRKVGAVYGPGSSYAGSAAPWYPTAEERQEQQRQEAPAQARAAQPNIGRSGIPLTTHPFGEGNLSGGASQLAAINQEMQRTSNLAPQVGQSMQQSMSQAGSAAQQAAPPFRQGLNQMQQQAQQLPGQVAAPMSQLPQQMAQPMAQLAPMMQQAMPQSPMQHLIQAVQDQAQPAGAAAANVGASTGQGFSEGQTKEETHTITKIRKWIEKIIDVAASGLDSHSPSRVFMGLGSSVGQGMALGVESSSQQAVQATQSMIGQMTSGASGSLADQQRQIAQQQQQGQQAIQQAQQAAQAAQAVGYQQPPGLGGMPYANSAAAVEQAKKKEAEEYQRALQTGDTSRLSPAARQQVEAQNAELHTYADGSQFSKNRYDQLSKLGYGEDTLQRVQEREARHNKTADEKKDQRRQDHLDAMMRAGSESSVRTKLAHEFGQHGKAAGDGTADGLKRAQGNVNGGVADMVNGMINESKKRLGISSPSRVFAGIGGDTGAGLAGGLAGAVTSASTAAMGVADDRGLQLGYRWGTSIMSGVQSVLKMTDYQAAGLPQGVNQQAMAALGKMGVLVAGSGAMISKFMGVNFPAGGAAGATPVVQSNIHLTVNLDGQPFRQMTATALGNFAEQIATSVATQVG